MKIRDAKDADLAAIVAIYNIAVATRISTAQLEQVTVEERRNWIREHSPEWVKRFSRGEPISFAFIQVCVKTPLL